MNIYRYVNLLSERLPFPEIPWLSNAHHDKLLHLLYCLIHDSDRRSREYIYIGTGEREKLGVSGCVDGMCIWHTCQPYRFFRQITGKLDLLPGYRKFCDSYRILVSHTPAYKNWSIVAACPETAGKMKAICFMTASLRSVACDMVESTMCELVCFGFDFDRGGIFVRNSCSVDDRTVATKLQCNIAGHSQWITRSISNFLCLLRGGLREEDCLKVKARKSKPAFFLLGSQSQISCADHKSVQWELSTPKLALVVRLFSL